MLQTFILVLFTTFMISPALAANLSELQAAVIQEDFKKAGALAETLLAQRLSRQEIHEVQYYQGLSALRLSQYVRAEEIFRKLLADRPANEVYDKAAVGRIDALYLQGYYENALKEANGLISRRKESEMMSLFYLKSARANLKLARWNKAREMLEKITAEYPGTFENDVAKQLLNEKQYFTVQVGSFAEKSRAEKLIKELIQRKEYAYMVETRTSDNRVYFRVRVGQMSSLKDAQELETKLAGLGYPTLIYP